MKPLTVWLAQDGTVFLPIEPAAVVTCKGCDQASKECKKHENKLSKDKTRKADDADDGCSFEQFWDAYGIKRDRKAAERAWNRLSRASRRAAYDGIARYKADCAARGINCMYAQGYLNHERWKDEINDSSNGATAATGTDRRKVGKAGVDGRMVPPEGGENAAPRYRSTI